MSAQDTEYRKLHHWLINTFGYANKCEEVDCNFDNPKRFEWALINGKNYEYKRENFMMLCPSCHRKYDYYNLTEEERRKINKWKIGRNPNNMRGIQQYTKNGIFVKDYLSIKQTSEETGILRTAIINNLSNTSMSSGGYIFKYVQL